MLLVDDRKIFLRTVRRMPFFRDHEEEIRIEWETCRADSALEILRKEHVDIVMTDIRMPMMSGGVRDLFTDERYKAKEFVLETDGPNTWLLKVER